MDIMYSVLSASFFGGSGLLDTMLVRNNDIFEIFILKQFVYFFVSIIIFLFLFKNLHSVTKLKVEHRDMFILFVAATLGTMGTFLFLYSLSKSQNKYLTFGILYTLPLIIYSILNCLVLKASLTHLNIFGIILVVLGLLLIGLEK